MPSSSSGGSLVTSANIVDGEIINADINAAAAISASKISGLPYAVLADVTNAGAAASLASGNFTGKTHLRCIIKVPSNANAVLCWRYNGDAGNNYNNQRVIDGVSSGAESGVSYHYANNGNDVGPQYIIVDIFNVAAAAKSCMFRQYRPGSFSEGGGQWTNAVDLITSITVLNNIGGNLGAGSRIVVLGMD